MEISQLLRVPCRSICEWTWTCKIRGGPNIGGGPSSNLPMDLLEISPLPALTPSPLSADAQLMTRGTWFSAPITLPAQGSVPPASAGGAAWELWARVFVELADPAAYASCCRLFFALSSDPILRAYWLQRRFGPKGALRNLLFRYSRLFTPSLGKAVIAMARKHADRNDLEAVVPRWWLQCAVRGLVGAGAHRNLATATAGNQAGFVPNGNVVDATDGGSPASIVANPVPNNTPVTGDVAAALPPIGPTAPLTLLIPQHNDQPGGVPAGFVTPALLSRVIPGGAEPVRIPLTGRKATAMLTFLIVLGEELFGTKADLTGDDFADLATSHGLHEAAGKMRSNPSAFIWPIRLEREEDLSPFDDDVDEEAPADEAPVQPEQQQANVAGVAAAPAEQAAFNTNDFQAERPSQRKLFRKYALSPLHFGRLSLLPIHTIPGLAASASTRFNDSPDLLLRTWNPLFEIALRDPKLFAVVMDSLDADLSCDADGKGICAELVGRLILHARWRSPLPSTLTLQVILDRALVKRMRSSGQPLLSSAQLAWLLERVDLFDGDLCSTACQVFVDVCRKQELVMGQTPGDATILAAAMLFLGGNPTCLFALFERFKNHFVSPSSALATLFSNEEINRAACKNRFVTPYQVCRKLSTYVTIWDGIRQVIGDFIGTRDVMIRMMEGLWPFSDASRLQTHAELFKLADLSLGDALVMYAGSSAFLRTDANFHRTIVTERWAPYFQGRGPERCIQSLLVEMHFVVEEFAAASRPDFSKGSVVSPGEYLLGENSVLFWHTLAYPIDWLVDEVPFLGVEVVRLQIMAISAACGSEKLRTANMKAIELVRQCLSNVETELVVDLELFDFVRHSKIVSREDGEFLRLFFELCRARIGVMVPQERQVWKDKAQLFAKTAFRRNHGADGALGFNGWILNQLLPELQ